MGEFWADPGRSLYKQYSLFVLKVKLSRLVQIENNEIDLWKWLIDSSSIKWADNTEASL